MQYKTNVKIIIDKRKLDTLIRLGCPDSILIDLIKTGEFKPTGDTLIDDTLECLLDVKSFSNWGGKRDGAGKKPKEYSILNQDEKQDDNHLEKQDGVQVVDKDKDIDKDKNIYKKKRASVVSEDWRPKEETIKKLEQKNLDVEKVIDKFINSCQASGRKYIDFDRAILSWNWEYDNSVKKRIIELPSSTYDSKKYDGMSSMAEMIKKQSMEKAMKKFGGGL